MQQFVKYWLPLVIWLIVIFVGSTDVMSAEHTSRYLVPFLLWVKSGMSPNTIWIIVVIVRKCAHVAEYAVLALLLWRALRSVPAIRMDRPVLFGAVLLGCALFAVSDEFHQTFVKSRTPALRDVFVDLTGALVGLIGVSFTRRDRRQIQSTNHTHFMDG